MNRHALIAIFTILCLVAGAAPSRAEGGSDPAEQFYRQRANALAWSGSTKADAQARQARAVLSNAASEGLDPDSYRVASEGSDRAAYDAALSKAVLSYMRDVAIGRTELRAIDTDIALPVRSPDFAAMLNRALGQDRFPEMLDSLAPRHAGYTALREALWRGEGNSDILAANMERWRWLPPVLESDRIMVNSAESQLELWLAGKLVLTSRVVVGRPSSRTPILRAEGGAITVNPAWTVPHSIAAKEILPKLKKNRAWLANHDMVLLDGPSGDPHGLGINWKAVRPGTFPYQIRQNPGPRNPLGRIKLELPNSFNVYLHDTPDQALFGKAKRQLSHGCVRVEQILPLASYVLAADLSATDKIMKAIETGETTTTPLQKKVPVYFVYWTAMSASGGTLRFHPDVYGRDRRLIAAMGNRQVQMAAIDPPCMKG